MYFAYTGTTPIPASLDLRLLDKAASYNGSRVAFYKALGVEDCCKEVVFAKIKERHQGSPAAHGIKEELRYMYCQHYDPDDILPWMRVPGFFGATRQAIDLELYLPSNGEFDMHRLVPPTWGYYILSQDIFSAELSGVRVNNLYWKAWLVRATGAMYFPALLGAGRDGNYSLSPGLQCVLELNAAKFLGTLRAHWDVYQKSAQLVAAELGCCSVACRSGDTELLPDSYLPTIDILAELDQLGVDYDNVPLFAVPEGTLDGTSYRSWKFLEDFGVCLKPDMEFYKQAIISKNEEHEPELEEVVEIYRGIACLATLADYTSTRYYDHNKPVLHGSCANSLQFVFRRQLLDLGHS